MRKFFAIPAIILFSCASCNTTTTVAGQHEEISKTQRNLEADNIVIKAFETGDVSGLDSVVAADYLDHTERGDKQGRDSLKALIQFVRTNFKDMKTELIRQIADSEYVYSLMRFTGTTDGTTPGMPAGPYDMHSLQVTRFKEGKAVEHWEYMETQEMMRMMGQSSGVTIDSTKKND